MESIVSSETRPAESIRARIESAGASILRVSGLADVEAPRVYRGQLSDVERERILHVLDLMARGELPLHPPSRAYRPHRRAEAVSA